VNEDAISSLQSQIASLVAQINELKTLVGVNYDLKKQLDVKTAENQMLRMAIETLHTRIAEFETGAAAPLIMAQADQPTIRSYNLRWPKSADTGVPSGTILADYSGPPNITVAGTVIENCNISGTITVKAANVVIRNCKFKGFTWYGILHESGENLWIERCEFDGRGSTGTTGVAISGGTLIGCNIYGMVIAVKIWGPNTIKDNYIHDLADTSSDPDSRHFDGISLLGGGDTVIEHNAIIMPQKEGGTAAVFISAQQGNISNVKVLNNLLMGKASFTAYADNASGTVSDVVFDGNYIEKGIHGYILNSSGAQDTNNVKWDATTLKAPAAVQVWLAAD